MFIDFNALAGRTETVITPLTPEHPNFTTATHNATLSALRFVSSYFSQRFLNTPEPPLRTPLHSREKNQGSEANSGLHAIKIGGILRRIGISSWSSHPVSNAGTNGNKSHRQSLSTQHAVAFIQTFMFRQKAMARWR